MRVAPRCFIMNTETSRAGVTSDQLEVLLRVIEEIPELVMVTTRDGTIEYVNRAFEEVSGYSRAEIVGRRPNVLKSGEHDDAMYKQLWATVLQGEVYRGALINRRKDSRLYCENKTIVPIRDEQSAIAGFIAIGTDVTERVAQEGALRQSERSLGLLAGAFPGIAYSMSLSDRTEIELLNDNVFEMTGFSADELMQAGEFPMSSLMSEVDRSRRSGEILDAAKSQRPFRVEYAVQHRSGTQRHFLECGRLIRNPNAPVPQVYGVILDVSDSRKLEESLRESEEALSGLSARILDTQEFERQRVARELHDGVGQMLTSIKMHIENASTLISDHRTGNGLEVLAKVVSMVPQIMDEVRRISMDLRPSILDDLGIIATINWFCRNFAEASQGIRIQRDILLEENEVHESHKIVIYRVLQEAMNNVAKHSKADLVRVRLSRLEDHIELAVEDNGCGFDVDRSLVHRRGRQGFGLSSMEERLKAIGGYLSVKSTKQIGTIVRAILPYSPRDKA